MKRRLRDGIRTAAAGGELTVYDGNADTVHVLNATGAFILETHRAGKTVAEIETMLKDAFSLDPGKDLKPEIRRFLGDLKKRKIFLP